MRTPLDKFYPLIPAGGVGSRLWPLSRAHAPKFLLDLTGNGSSLLRQTYDRLSGLTQSSVMIVTGESHAQAVREQVRELNDTDFVLEPSPKDSAAAIGLACAILYKRDREAIIGSFAADHVITPVEEFQKVVKEAVETAATGKIVTIGITPTEPSTAFGYIKAKSSLGIDNAPSALAVESFVEKPDAATAADYVNSGEYTWNAGMFVAPAELMLKHLKENEPELYAGINAIAEDWDTPQQHQTLQKLWDTLPKTAIDYAVAEPAAVAGDVAMVPGSFTWDDVGDFDAVTRLNQEKTGEKLTVLGEKSNVLNQDSSGLIVTHAERKIAVIGIENLVVVDTPDALLITTRDKAQAVKNTVADIKELNLNELL
ncbi:mannose-1-phosphate guanylyltransferase [Rothia sp. CCM 9418]|uniref:mannose-1-phosphate guanylyltransferase n=1 Tax=Rothia sp. CCM 9418 TaxID=3402661 RepID=UPI003AE1A36B